MVEVVFSPDLKATPPEWLIPVTEGLQLGIGSLLSEMSLPMAETRLVIATDVLAASGVERERLGLPADSRTSTERVGGVVAGKCLLSHASNEATIVISDMFMGSDGALPQLQLASALAHEFAHLFYDTVREAAVGAGPSGTMPWEIARHIPLEAAEEYRADFMGNAAVQEVFQPADSSGRRVDLAELFGANYKESLVVALDEISPKLEDSIMEYRLHRLGLTEMWNEVARTSEGISICIAHTQAYAQDPQPVLAAADHRGAHVFEPFWCPFVAYIQEHPQVPSLDDWQVDRSNLMAIGYDGFTEAWRRLGLSARPEGETFYLSVFDPS
jgi:hypothetical protein